MNFQRVVFYAAGIWNPWNPHLLLRDTQGILFYPRLPCGEGRFCSIRGSGLNITGPFFFSFTCVLINCDWELGSEGAFERTRRPAVFKWVKLTRGVGKIDYPSFFAMENTWRSMVLKVNVLLLSTSGNKTKSEYLTQRIKNNRQQFFFVNWQTGFQIIAPISRNISLLKIPQPSSYNHPAQWKYWINSDPVWPPGYRNISNRKRSDRIWKTGFKIRTEEFQGSFV